jgi:hypothetical protein
MKKVPEDNRENKEIKRLKAIYKNLPSDKLGVIEKLIERAAYMLITLQDMEKKISEDGLLLEMSQGNYSISRAHPLLSPYNSTIKNYASVIKQMNDLLPSAEQETAGQALMDFVSRTVIKK